MLRFSWNLTGVVAFYFKNKSTFTWDIQDIRCVKSVRIRSFYGLYFPAFGLNTEIYTINLRIQSECSKVRTRKIPNTDTAYNTHNITSLIRTPKHVSDILQTQEAFTVEEYKHTQTHFLRSNNVENYSNIMPLLTTPFHFAITENFENSHILWGKSTSFKEMNAGSLWKVFTSKIWLYSKARQVFVNKHEVLESLVTICSLSCFILLFCFLIRKDLGQFTSKYRFS